MEQGGGYVTRPPLLDGSNYDYWKSRMVAFLKSIDSKTWKAVVKGWEHPVVTDKDGNNTAKLKSEVDWSKEEDELAHGNSKALNALFNGVDKNMFRLIKQCTVAKDAWEILETTHEGTSKVKMSRLQLLTTKFENLRMEEYECIHDFHMNILDFANSFDSLGEKISEEKLVRKILRSLPKRFDMKVTTIEEAQDISNMRVSELIGSLQTFEIAINDRYEKKKKNLAFVSNTDEEDVQMETDESILNTIMRIGRELNKVLEMMDKKSRPNVKDMPSDNFMNIGFSHNNKTEERPNKCKGSKSKKCDDETTKRVMVLTGKCDPDEESSDEDISDGETVETYKLLHTKWVEACNLVEEQKKIISDCHLEKEKLMSTITGLQEEATLLNSKLESMTKSIRMLNNGSNVLDEILQAGKTSGNMKGIGFDNGTMNNEIKIPTKKFVSPVKKTEFIMLDHMSQHPTRHLNPQSRNKKKSSWRCHHCGRYGHIRPFCYKLYGYPKRSFQPKVSSKIVQARKEWKPKDDRNDDPFVVESVHVSPSKVVHSDPLSSSTKVVVESVVGSTKEILLESDVVPDVSTSLAQSGQYVETIQENPRIEYEYESTSEDEKSQSEIVTDNGEEEKFFCDERKKFASGGEDQSLSNYEKGFVVSNVETMSLVKPSSDETLGHPSVNVAIESANMSPTKVVDSILSLYPPNLLLMLLLTPSKNGLSKFVAKKGEKYY
ncbi:hypothetical protein QL285_085090 [Trifolium repens]|nr:hypothetical protein QL285_085090 [Trifolium repens]